MKLNHFYSKHLEQTNSCCGVDLNHKAAFEDISIDFLGWVAKHNFQYIIYDSKIIPQHYNYKIVFNGIGFIFSASQLFYLYNADMDYKDIDLICHGLSSKVNWGIVKTPQQKGTAKRAVNIIMYIHTKDGWKAIKRYDNH